MDQMTNADWFMFGLACIALGRMAYYLRLIVEEIGKDDNE